MNGAVVVTVSILKLVATSAAEAELGGLFHNSQTATVRVGFRVRVRTLTLTLTFALSEID